VAGPGMDEMTMMNIQEMIGGMLPKKTKKRRCPLPKPGAFCSKKNLPN
jgi:hypothetical protein